jgi:hypothetical protein
VGSVSADVIALGALLVLVLVMRWVFAPPRQRRGRPVDASDASRAELGLLTVVDTALSRSDALQARAVLGDADIRSSMSRRRDGRYDVLVFTTDVDRARALLS